MGKNKQPEKKNDKDQKEEKDKPKSTAKREFISEIESSIQKQWDQNKIFETEVDHKREKYLACFPYPYMNGRLHVGHVFSASKIEFACNYQRMTGKNVLWPFGFHCTGMPIVAAANKLKSEIETYGNPPVFPQEAPVQAAAQPPAEPKKKAQGEDPTKFSGKKTKLVQKGGNARQWDIMLGHSVNPNDIPQFIDPAQWIKYFPNFGISDLKGLGFGIDWRRSFITTDLNPYYDSFVRWQFNRLKELGKIKFGKRYSIYSPSDKGICLDHDRASGEGVLPQEYTGIKLELYEPYPEKIAHLQGKFKVSLIAGTLRPETMYGQTNCWVLPTAEYGVFQINSTEAFICTDKAARNMSFQDLSPVPQEVTKLCTVTGWDILKIPVKAPLSKYPLVYTLPMMTIIPEKGTGIVTSVPSDSPDDWINLAELKKKAEWRKKEYGIEDYMVDPYEVIPIIQTPDYGDNAAEKVIQELKINGPKQRELLDKAKDIVYKQGFNEGTLIVGEWKGKKVNEVKTVVKQYLVEQGYAVPYCEPTSKVMSRSGDECVVAYIDQWYLDYGEESWKKQLKEYYDSVNFYSPETKQAFYNAADWLGSWACSRSFGLGTKIPWDEKYLIDSLSDSTIYMAFYTVCHMLQGNLFGTEANQNTPVKPEQLTKDVWDYIFDLRNEAPQTDIAAETLEKMRESFKYWYPVDIRSSGRDLIQNHLTFFFYNHLALFGPEKAPRSVRANGFTLLNNEKMSKSTGNFLTLFDSIQKYGSDATRLAFADAGDGLVDANFSETTADTGILKLHAQYKFFEDIVEGKVANSDDPPSSWEDIVFQTKTSLLIQQTQEAYEAANYRDAMKYGFYEMIGVGNKYCQGKSIKKKLLEWYVEVSALCVAPICPHFAEHVWKNLLKKEGSVRFALFPKPLAVDPIVVAKDEYIESVSHDLNRKVSQSREKKKKGNTTKDEPPTKPKEVEAGSVGKIVVTYSRDFPDWMKILAKILKPYFTECAQNKTDPSFEKCQVQVKAEPELKKWIKQCVFQIKIYVEAFQKKGAAVLDQAMPFNEESFLKESIPLFIQENNILREYEFEIVAAEGEQLNKIFPGNPQIQIIPK